MTPFFEHFAIAVGAISGVLAAEGKKVDLFGILVLAMVTGFGGGTLRDLLLGALPPPWLKDPAVLYTGTGAGVFTFIAARRWTFPSRILMVADAFGLALFAVLGAKKALQFEAAPYAAVALGVITGVAGGMIRDTLLREIPMVFRREIHLYATAAFAGTVLYVSVPRSGWHGEQTVFITSVVLILVLRLAAMRWRLGLPDFQARQRG